MLIAAVLLNLLVALGLTALAAKYAFGPVPADYHAAILATSGQPIGPHQLLVFGAINKVFAGCFLALAIALTMLTVFGVWQEMYWAKIGTAAIAVVAGVPSSFAAYTVEQTSGVRTPWRSGALLSVLVLIAFVLSVA